MQQRRTVPGIVGPIEVALDLPREAARGVAFIGHPHPLYGGTLDNKVVATLARAFAAAGLIAVRPNFRGVGASAGIHDHGAGETDDFMHLIDTAAQWSEGVIAAELPLALAGFSFGSFVAAQACQRLGAGGRLPRLLVLVGAAAGKWPLPAVPVQQTLVIHGECDETIPLSDVLAWARPQELPVVVLPGADHFFHRRLSTLKRLLQVHLCSAFDAAAGSD
ncbi:MAG: alpha/beta hydrolase [Burkholderiaceae bacterium]|nr:alpha/beta hydrolase [Burkholderiaceae bacterium]MCX7901342.1 alpha/beta hydrolase [Burkholderiaceae bacterium]